MQKKLTFQQFLATALLLIGVVFGQNAFAESSWTINSSYNSSTKKTKFTIKRSEHTYPQTVLYRTVGLSAYPGQHYTAVAGELNFAANDSIKEIEVMERTPTDLAYMFQSGSTRTYSFEVTDKGGFVLISKQRDIPSGTSVNSSSTTVFGDKELPISSGTITVTDGGYDQAYHSVNVNNYYSASAPKNYFTAIGAQLRMTVTFDAREKDDGYQYIAIYANTNTGNVDTGAKDGNPGTINYSKYMAGFTIDGNVSSTFYPYTFPLTSNGNACGAVAHPWPNNSNGNLKQQYFNTNCRATDGRLIIPTDLSNLYVRFNASGNLSDTWYAQNVKAHIQAVDNTAPTMKGIVADPGRHARGNTVYVSVAFSEIMKVTGTPTLSIYWGKTYGTLDYTSGSGSNVLTFKGIIPQNVSSSSISITDYDGTIQDLAGNNFSGSISYTDLFSTNADLAYALSDFRQDDNDNYLITCHDDLRGLAGYVKGGGSTSDKTFRQVTDLTFPYSTQWNNSSSTENGFTSIGSYDHPFQGTYDGEGHTISGLRIYNASDYQGLFGDVNGTVKRVNLTNTRITGKSYVGGIAGQANSATIEDCAVADNVCIHAAQTGASSHGGIVGNNSDGTVQRCISHATLSVTSTSSCNYYGGIVGRNLGNSSINNCLAIGATIPSVSKRGAILGYRDGGSLTRNYYLNCTVAGTANATNVGYNGADYTVSGGSARAIYALTLGQHIAIDHDPSATLPGSGNITYDNGANINGQPYSYATATLNLTYNSNPPTGYHVRFTANAGSINGNTLTMPASAVTVSTDFVANTYSVRFNKNNTKATGTMANQGFTYGVTQPLNANNYSLAGYLFNGWNTQSNGSGTSYTDQQSVSNLTATDNVTVNLYAQWIEDPDACHTPTLSNTVITQKNQASLQWTTGNATEWVLQYSTSNNFGNASSVNVSTTPSHTITGLDAGTRYYTRIKAVCNDEWSNVVSFTTKCEPSTLTYAAPFREGFEGYTGTSYNMNGEVPDCWDRYRDNGLPAPHIISSGNSYAYIHEGNKALTFFGKGNCYAALPAFTNPISELRIKFWMEPENANYGTLTLGYVTAEDDGTFNTFEAIPNITISNSNDMVEYGPYILDQVPATATRLVFRWYFSSQYSCCIDDVEVSLIPTCNAPTNFTATNTNNSAELSWTDHNSDTPAFWRIYYKKTTDASYTTVDVITNPYTLNGLDGSSKYQCYVVAHCSADSPSDPSNVCTFLTSCDAVTIDGDHPYTEDFDNYTDTTDGTITPSAYPDDEMPPCWLFLNRSATDDDYPQVFLSSYNNYVVSGNCLFFKSSDTIPLYTILPEFTNNTSALQLTFTYRNEGVSTNNGTLYVSYMTDPADTSTFSNTYAIECPQTTTLTEKTVYFPYATTGSRIAFKYKGGLGSPNYYLSIDNVSVALAPACPAPSELVVSNLTSNSATIAWVENSQPEKWQVCLNGDETNLIETNNTPFTLTGLSAFTAYTAKVRAYCSGDDQSSWSNAVSFTTQQEPVNLPYSTDFESSNEWLLVNGNCTNAWAYGSATYSGQDDSGHALYISNNEGLNNEYSFTSPSMVYATKPFNFDAGFYNFSYDWKAAGEKGSDYMRVALVPSSVILTAGTTKPEGFSATNLPDGWISLDNHNQLNEKGTGWQTLAVDEIEVAEAGIYYMVFTWRNDSSLGDNPPAAIDNVSIQMEACPKPSNLEVSRITNTTATLSWTDYGGATTWQIKLNDNEDDLIVATSNPFTLTGLSPETYYEANVRAYCDTDNQSSWNTYESSFTTKTDCMVPEELNAEDITASSARLNWISVQGAYNVRYRKTNEIFFEGFENGPDYGLDDWTLQDCDISTGIVNAPECIHSGNYAFMFRYNYKPPQYLISPEITGVTEGMKLEFFYKNNNSDYPETFHVGFSSTDKDITSFTFGEELTASDEQWHLYSETIPAGTKYICWKLTSYDKYELYIDDISVCTPFEWISRNSVSTPVIISGLEPNTKYIWQVQGVSEFCYGGGTGLTEWSDYVRFTTSAGQDFVKDITGYSGNNDGWYLIASPVGNVAPSDVIHLRTNTYDLYRFDQSAAMEWQNYKAHFEDEDNPFNTLVSGQGYLYANSANVDLTFTGTAYTGSGEVTLRKTGGRSLEGWNLVGNPFAETAYIVGGRSFMVINDEHNDIVPAERNYINPMEGIFVQATTDNETITFTTEAPAASAKGNEQIVVNVTRSRGAAIDRAIVRFGEGRQLPKFQLRDDGTKLYITKDHADYAVVHSEKQGEMPLCFKAHENGEYTLTISSPLTSNLSSLTLIDNLTGANIDLLTTPSYTFTARNDDYESRFRLVFSANNDSNDDFAFISNGNLIVTGEGTLQVVDVMGRILVTKQLSTTNFQLPTSNFTAGVYVLQLINGEKVKTQKIVIR